ACSSTFRAWARSRCSTSSASAEPAETNARLPQESAMSFNASLSGINAANADLNVTSNNIANSNTVGFKTSRAEFADLFSSTSYGLANSAVGSGVKVSNVAQQFAQGNIDPTGRSLDFAIDGEGFFTVRKNGDTMYTRAGNFQPDNRGFVVTPD